MRCVQAVPDLSFLPDSTQHQVRSMIAYVQSQQALNKFPRVDGTGVTQCDGIDVHLAILKKNPCAAGGVNGRTNFIIRVSPLFPTQSLLIYRMTDADTGHLSLMQEGWPQMDNLCLMIKDLCLKVDGSTAFREVKGHSPVHPVHTLLSPPSTPTINYNKFGNDDLQRKLFRCKWMETAKQFFVPMISTILQLRQVIERHIPAAIYPEVSLKLLRSPQDAMFLRSDEDIKWLFSTSLPVVYILLQGQISRSLSAHAGSTEPNCVSSKRNVESLAVFPKCLYPASVGEVDLLGLYDHSTTQLHNIHSELSSTRRHLISHSLGKILKPGTTIREVDWKDLGVQKYVGTGSSCQVYKGIWRGAEVAVKSFTNTDRSCREREFANEVDVMQQLGPNPSLVTFFAVCSNPLSIVLEYLPFSLFELINGVSDKARRIPPFPVSWTVRVRLMLDIARGLQFLHSFDIIHRDLKSLNLLMTAEGRVKLADFGRSRSNDQTELMTGCCGTFQWMAPEVLTSMKYSLSADVYSLGVVLWEICEAAAPFKDLAPPQIPLAVVQERRRPIISAKTPLLLRNLIQRCWQHEAALRPTAADVVGTLQSCFSST
ncbi:tkl protein kinase [Plasmopara halstedii]|uniref:Tkl protein kinase n=1 Tax=Plasmopara halstedii TaxID=4781 RepID=A0A0P1AZG1_PLAHL|nr:tkl protein kinase [Plasmopara halstedii]CEG47477.1 tkl protein kinase [Plasmopara halstedii]|eukprot:XP_024583846.1 tkl protein kinase [Plasmopara halstedii]